jgi:RNA polymerase sigma-70 factor, ECF subfamily
MPSSFTFMEFYEAHYHRLHRYFEICTKSVHDADDLAQDLCLKMYHTYEDGKEIHNLHGLTTVAARNAMRSFFLKKNKYLFVEYLDDVVGEEVIDLKEEHSHLMDLIEEGMNNILPRYREIIHLRYYHGLDNKEIAKHLGISYVASKTRLSRALKSLKKKKPISRVQH